MLSLGPLVFAQPLILAALGILPIIYWLLRVTPPAPRRLAFPAIRLLFGLAAREETPARTPWWLLALRLLIAALVILGLARPLINPSADYPGTGPIILVVDNGWAAASDWTARRAHMDDVIDRAERQGRRVIVLATAPTEAGEAPARSVPLRPTEARALLEALSPQPWPTDRAAALVALEDLTLDHAAHAVWLTDGVGDGEERALAARLQQLGSADALVPQEAMPLLMTPPSLDGLSLRVGISRPEAGAPRSITVRAAAADGRPLGRETVVFGEMETESEATFSLPVELRNDVARIDVEGHASAGATVLLDDRWRRRPVGLVSVGAEAEMQPLLADTHYIQRALEPFSELRHGDVLGLLESGVAVLVLPDIGQLNADEAAAVESFVSDGGVLIRFAGPLMAVSPDDLFPVRLRLGDRTLSGALSWTEPMPLAPFEPGTPFADLTVPDDVLVGRQVLAEPSLDLSDRTWARLVDGTPLVTADRRGQEGQGGWVVLVHVTAGPEWSNLPLSGLFVEMLRRLVELSSASQAMGTVAGPGTLDPIVTLDGFARLGTPPAMASPLSPDQLGDPEIGPRSPPGLYGTEDARRALNLGDVIEAVEPLGPLPAGVSVSGYERARELDLMPWLMAAALALMIADLAISLMLRRAVALPLRPRTAAGIAAAVALGLSALPGDARADETFALTAANETYLAYVITGDPTVDEISRAGLETLSLVLRTRTAVEAAGALGVNVATDELAFFPLLYWPVTDTQPALSTQAVERLNDYLRFGGTIVFDTRDQGVGGEFGSRVARMQELTAGLDIPELTPVPPEHVLTKAFYLMQDFPGRYAGGEVWVQTTEEHINDGVSSIIIGGNDWAAAWAADGLGQPLFAVVPGGDRQREMAYRFGVNLVMYALTGNYKADQVHVPAILERLGQ